VAVAIGPAVFVVDRLTGTVAWGAFLTEALTSCMYAAVAVWYAMRYRRGTAWRAALMVYFAGLVIMGAVVFITKQGLSTPLVDSPRAGDSILWVGLLMVAFGPLLGWIAWRYPDMRRVGLGVVYSRSRLGWYALVGLAVGLLIALHFWLTARAAGIELDVKPWPYMAWQLFYEIGPKSLTEELFMRGVVFNELYFGREWNFWAAALMVSSLEVMALLVRQDFSSNLILVVGAVFYVVVSGVASAGLFRWSRSVIPGYVSNVTVSVVSIFS
jgi:hypothetical protein